jgi:outer membrane protein TolC
MKVIRFRIFLGIATGVWLAFGALIFSGCSASCPYTYDEIITEYKDRVCFLKTDAKTTIVDRETRDVCRLNKRINLSEAVNISLANNPDVRMAASKIKEARAEIQKANASFYPVVGFYTEYMNGDAPSSYLFKKIDQRKLPQRVNFNEPGSFENYESGLNFKVNLFNGGRDVMNRLISDSGYVVSEQERMVIQNTLMANVISAYYNVLAARDFIKIARDSETTVKKQLKIMRVRFRGGGALKSDILSLEVRLAEAREQVVSSQNRWKMALNALKMLMGVSPESELTLEEAQELTISLPDTYERALPVGVARRPELAKVREQLKQSRIGVDMARSAYLPMVDFKGRYYMDDESMGYETSRDNWFVALVLNWQVFSGFKRDAEIKTATAKLLQMLSADRKTVLAIKTDIKNAYLKLEEATARLEVARKSVARAEESLSLVKNQYEGGAANITRYLQAELDFTSTKIRSTAAYYDREKALADVGRAIGYFADLKKPFSGHNPDIP